MKKIIIAATLGLLSNSIYANDMICINPLEQNITYKLQKSDGSLYNLMITNEVKDLNACRSRWGCDTEKTIIFQDQLEQIDVQGVDVFESKRIYIEVEDLDNVFFSFAALNTSGVYIQKTAKLKCELQ